jgi:hypothetical protein
MQQCRSLHIAARRDGHERRSQDRPLKLRRAARPPGRLHSDPRLLRPHRALPPLTPVGHRRLNSAFSILAIIPIRDDPRTAVYVAKQRATARPNAKRPAVPNAIASAASTTSCAIRKASRPSSARHRGLTHQQHSARSFCQPKKLPLPREPAVTAALTGHRRRPLRTRWVTNVSPSVGTTTAHHRLDRAEQERPRA